MGTKTSTPRLLQAKILGRVERLLGRDCVVNPYPARSEQWEAFQEGWFRDLGDPITREICKRSKAGNRQLQEC